MNGAESLVRTLIAGGVKTCFTNPGTSEMHIVAALDGMPEMRCVLGLFEGVVTGAADGYGRIAEKPACTLLHLGPGLANGLANLHNAKRARVPILNVIGQHATKHLQFDTPLKSDIEAIARPYCKWLRTARTASEIGVDAADAIRAACEAPAGIASLIVPADVAWSEGGAVEKIAAIPGAPLAANETIERVAAMLRSDRPTAILLDGNALYGKGLTAAGRIAAATKARLFAPYPFPRLERGAGRPVVERIAYIFEQAVEQLKEIRQLILVGASPPISYFAHPSKKSAPTSPECEIVTLAHPGEDYAGSLEALTAALSLNAHPYESENPERPAMQRGNITASGIAAGLGALLPEDAILIDESMTSGRGIMSATKGCPPHDLLANTGGSSGIAMPLAVGAAVARPGRRVLALSADGSGMYTAQALWSMARENLDVTTVIFANREYAVLKREFSALVGGSPGPRATALFEIGNPELDWVALAKALGVPGTRPGDLEAFNDALRESLASKGPSLIEVRL